MADIFISYVHEDHGLAESIATFLREKGFRDVFFTGDNWLLYAGEVWLQRIREELSAATVVLCLISPRSIDRPWVHFEAGAAWLSPGKVLIPVCVGGLTVSDLRVPYSGIQSITLADSSSGNYLIGSIWKHLKPETPIPPVPFAPNDHDWKKLESALQSANKR